MRRDHHVVNVDPIRQVLAQAAWLRDLLRESTGKAFLVKPVIVFPGWFAEGAATTEAKKRGAWLLNPKALPSFIAAEPALCGIEDLKLAGYHLRATSGDALARTPFPSVTNAMVDELATKRLNCCELSL